jgi:hypothetical protein
MTQPPLLGQGLLIIEASQLHSHTPHSVGILWTTNQPETEITPNIHKRHIHARCGIRNRNPSKLAVALPRLRPRVCLNQLSWYWL